MNIARPLAAALSALSLFGMAGCFSTAPRPVPPPVPPPPAAENQPQGAVPEVVPRAEPRSRYGNPAFYDVFGKRYYVLSSGTGYLERGVASWYGPGFHQVRTSTGEIYDMYGMTAAHKTLPLPAYVRVTNLQNGRSVVVRVNDRGPFVGNRIIDLSYTAASKLDMLRNGTAFVEVRSLDTLPVPAPAVTAAAGSATATITPATMLAAPIAAPTVTAATLEPMTTATPSAAGAPVAGAPLFIQAGAFSDPKNAERLADKLRGGGFGNVFVRDDEIAGRRMFRVRIGPVPDVAHFDRIVTELQRTGVNDAHLALD